MSAFDLQSFINQLAEQPQARAQLRALLLSDALQTLPERFERLTLVVTQLAEAQQRTEARLEQLAEAQQRTEQRLTRLEETVQALAEAQRRAEERLTRLEQAIQALVEAQQRNEHRLVRLEEAIEKLSRDVDRLVNWQRGESGRREGERFERQVVKRAAVVQRGTRRRHRQARSAGSTHRNAEPTMGKLRTY